MKTKNAYLPILLVAGGVAGGFLNGLLGCGGGIVIVALLSALTKDTDFDSRDVFAVSVAAVLPISAVSTVMYMIRTDASLSVMRPYVLPAVIGGAVGALLLDRLPTVGIKMIFALLIIWAGVSLVLKGTGVM